MGELEKKAKRNKTKGKIQGAVLATIQVAGVIAIAAVAPNIFQALPYIMGKQRYKLTFQTKTAIGRLIAKGHITRNDRGMLEITDTGARHIAIEQARANAPAKQKRRWDKQYRLVMFDILQRRRSTRDRLRLLMNEFGFLRLQDSVWVTPYDCEDLIALVKAELRVGKDVLYAVVNQIENDRWIKEHFGLSKCY